MKKYILLFVACFSLFGCKDFLTEAPMMSQSTELTLSTFTDLNLSVAGAYGPIASGSWYNADFITINEMKTDNGRKLYSSAWDTGRLTDWYNLNYSESTTSSIWSYAYYVISAVNNVMDNLEGKGAEQDLNNLKAECLFLRAFSHFDLVRTYAQPFCNNPDLKDGGVPIVLHTEASARPSRNTVREVYDQIIADLLEAESIIDPEYVRSGVSDVNATVTLEVIQALLARVYLYSQQWEKAAEYASKVIMSGRYTMWSMRDMTNGSCFTQNVGSGEVIFEVYQSTGNSYGGASNENVCGLTYWDGYGDAQATTSLINSYDSDDIRGKLFTSYTNADGDTGRWTLKYGGKGVSHPDVNNIIILRLSEMYLIRAEATLNGGLSYNALNDVNMIRNNRGVAALNSTPTLAQIYEENRLEFAWEAHLWFDLGRTGRAMSRSSWGDGAPTSVEVGAKEWAMPIPVREIQVNGNLGQNDGY